VLAKARKELEPLEAAIAGHPFLAEVERVSDETLRAFAGEQYAILRSDRRSFAHLAARFPEPPGGDLFLQLAEGEGVALGCLLVFANSLGVGERELASYEPRPLAQAYPAFVAWLALNGGRADVALAFLANLEAWGGNCARMATALRNRVDVSFFEFFEETPAGFEDHALAVIGQGLDAGESPEHAIRAAKRLQAYELLYWDSFR
jgi:thiaminase